MQIYDKGLKTYITIKIKGQCICLYSNVVVFLFIKHPRRCSKMLYKSVLKVKPFTSLCFASAIDLYISASSSTPWAVYHIAGATYRRIHPYNNPFPSVKWQSFKVRGINAVTSGVYSRLLNSNGEGPSFWSTTLYTELLTRTFRTKPIFTTKITTTATDYKDAISCYISLPVIHANNDSSRWLTVRM